MFTVVKKFQTAYFMDFPKKFCIIPYFTIEKTGFMY